MIRLEIAAPDEPLTSNQRRHYQEKARIVRNWRLRTAILARREKAIPHAHVIAYMHFPDKRRRDVLNYADTIKPCVDGCVDAGILPDDSDRYVVGPDMRPGEPSPGGLAITLTLNADCACADCVDRFMTKEGA